MKRLPSVFPALIMMLIVTGCGTQTALSTEAAEASFTSAPELPASAGVHGEARRVYERFAGTLEQRTAGELLRAYAVNGPLDKCMEEAGYPEWDWSLSRGYPVPEDPLAVTNYFSEPGRRVWSLNEMYSAPYVRAERKMNADDVPADRKVATLACVQQTSVPGEDHLARIGRPVGAEKLIRQWRSTLIAAEGRILGADAGGDYVMCMDAARIPVLVEAGRGVDDIGPVMAGAAPDNALIPAPGTPADEASQQWQEFLAVEDEYIAADMGCRRESYDRGIGEIANVVAEFERENEAAISEVELRWPDLVKDAQALGFAPGTVE